MPEHCLQVGAGAELLKRLLQSSSRIALAKTQAAQRTKGASLDERLRRRRPRAVRRAIGVAKFQPRLDVARAHEPALVQRPMMSSARRQQVISTVMPAVLARLEMMNIHESYVGTTWHLAAMAVAPEHTATNRRRYILRCA